MKRITWVLLALAAMVLAAVTPVGAASPPGSGPDNAITLSGTMVGTLGPTATRWYQFDGAPFNIAGAVAGVTMDYLPANSPLPSNIYFNVDWTLHDGQGNVDWPGYFRIGQGTTVDQTHNQRYWFTNSPQAATYTIEVVNSTNQSIGYAIAQTGATFPPPWLNPPAPGAVTTTAPVSTPTPVPAANATPEGPAPTIAANSATDQSGLVLHPIVDINGVFSTVRIRIDSTSANAVVVHHLVLIPPPGAVVDGVTPSETVPENGIAWYLSAMVDQNNPLSAYDVRFFGPANGTIVQADWQSSTAKGTLLVTISGAPDPAPVGQ